MNDKRFRCVHDMEWIEYRYKFSDNVVAENFYNRIISMLNEGDAEEYVEYEVSSCVVSVKFASRYVVEKPEFVESLHVMINEYIGGVVGESIPKETSSASK